MGDKQMFSSRQMTGEWSHDKVDLNDNEKTESFLAQNPTCQVSHSQIKEESDINLTWICQPNINLKGTERHGKMQININLTNRHVDVNSPEIKSEHLQASNWPVWYQVAGCIIPIHVATCHPNHICQVLCARPWTDVLRKCMKMLGWLLTKWLKTSTWVYPN